MSGYREYDRFCNDYHKHYHPLEIGNFNKWTAISCGIVVIGLLIGLWIIK